MQHRNTKEHVDLTIDHDILEGMRKISKTTGVGLSQLFERAAREKYEDPLERARCDAKSAQVALYKALEEVKRLEELREIKREEKIEVKTK